MTRLVGLLLLAVAAASPAAAGEPDARLHPDRLYDSKALLAASQDTQEPVMSPKAPSGNPKVAMLYSLLLPGLGEYALGHRDRAKIFFVAEGAIWTSFFVFRSQGNHRKDLYKEFAEVNAGPAQRDDDDYYRVIGNYIASDGPFSANEQVRREARALYPDDPAMQDQYFQDNAYLEDDAWRWEGEEYLDRYQEMRDASISAYNKSEFSIGLLIANRLISVVDTGLLAARRSREARPETGFRWGIEADATAARFTVSRSF